MKVKFEDGTWAKCDDTPVGSGKCGTVYLSKDRKFAFKFYHQTHGKKLQGIMRKVVTTYNYVANNEYWRSYFCWPDRLVVEPSLGIRMPAYPREMKPLSWIVNLKAFASLLPEEKRWFYRLLMAVRLARAVGRMHLAGLAHSDLSYNNIMINPNNGRIMIVDLDGIVVPQFLPHQVVGTTIYIAPEVLEGHATPSVLTDRHSLAVILYQLLLFWHPLKGPKIFDQKPQKNEARQLGFEAVYIDHPRDRSNQPVHVAGRGFWSAKILGPKLKFLFEKAFVEGIRNPSLRPSAKEWESALVHLIDHVVTCANPKCAYKYFPLATGVSDACPWCKTQLVLPRNLPIIYFLRSDGRGHFLPETDSWMAGYPGRTVHEWHAFPGKMPGEKSIGQVLGRIVFDRNKYFLRNENLKDLNIVKEGKAKNAVAVGEKIELTDKLCLLLDGKGKLAYIQTIS